jgi:hypothetical protein
MIAVRFSFKRRPGEAAPAPRRDALHPMRITNPNYNYKIL